MVRPIRRVVAGEDDTGKAVVHSDAPSSDVTLDPARPGYRLDAALGDRQHAGARQGLARDTQPAARHRAAAEGLGLPRGRIPAGGVLHRQDHRRRRGRRISPRWARPAPQPASASAPHPYMQRTEYVRLLLLLEGEITLVPDTEEVHLKEGDTVIQKRGTNHAWLEPFRQAVPRRVLAARRKMRGADQPSVARPAFAFGSQRWCRLPLMRTVITSTTAVWPPRTSAIAADSVPARSPGFSMR